MSDARWCDYGDHPFKGGRPGTIVMGRIEDGLGDSRFKRNEYVTEQQMAANMQAREVCPECAATLGMNDDYQAPLSPMQRHLAIAEEAGKHARKP